MVSERLDQVTMTAIRRQMERQIINIQMEKSMAQIRVVILWARETLRVFCLRILKISNQSSTLNLREMII